jgi:AraC-like DNA-binding protein
MAQGTSDFDPGDARLRLVIAGLTLSGQISLALTARNLGVSSRTLQRRLHERGISFWTIVDECRFRISGALLRETDLSVQEIAARVGYSTPGSFARAFARWAGLPPRAFRQTSAEEEGGQNIGAIWADLTRHEP